jgi:hypothetical protein
MRQKASKCTIRNREQTLRALELRSTGASYHEIGRTLGISKTRGYQLVMAELSELCEMLKESAAQLLALELARLDAILAAHWPLRAVPRNAEILLRVSERRAKLLGLDAPTKVAETDAAGKDLTDSARAALHAKLLE